MTWDQIKVWINELDKEQLGIEAVVLIDGKPVPVIGCGITYSPGETTSSHLSQTGEER